MYILLTSHSTDLLRAETAVLQLGSVALSLVTIWYYLTMTLSSSQVSLSLSLVSYSQASRWADPALPQLSPGAQLAQVQADTVMVILVLLTLLTLCWQWLWRMFSLSSRMFVFCLFLTLYPNQFFIFLVLHYLGMLVWVLAMRTNFCGSMDDTRRPVSEFVYNIVIAAVLIFDIVNIKDGPTRLRNSVYYTIVTLENTVLMVFWWSAGVSFIGVDKIVIVVVYAALQFLAFLFLAFYYRRMHPNPSLPDFQQTSHCL